MCKSICADLRVFMNSCTCLQVSIAVYVCRCVHMIVYVSL